MSHYSVQDWATLNAMSDDKVIEMMNVTLGATTQPAAFWIAEMDRRSRRRHDRIMLSLTAVVTVLTFANVGLVAWTIWPS
jgi:hypothetical protein